MSDLLDVTQSSIKSDQVWNEAVSQRASCIVRLRALSQLVPYNLAVGLIIVYSLFADYLRIILFTSKADLTFDVLTIVSLSLMLIDTTLNSMIRQHFFVNLQMAQEVLASLTLIMDINFFTNYIYTTYQESAILPISIVSRLVKIIRILWLVRLFKILAFLFENSNKPTAQVQEDKQLGIKERLKQQQERAIANSQTKISKILHKRSVRKVILSSMALMFFIPLFDVSIVVSPKSDNEYNTESIYELLKNPEIPLQDVSAFMKNITALESPTPFVVLETPFQNLYAVQQQLSSLRFQDIRYYKIDMDITHLKALRPQLVLKSDLTYILSVQDLSYVNRMTAGMEIGRIAFLVLACTTILIVSDLQLRTLLIEPIERLIFKIKHIARFPHQTAYLIQQLKTDNEFNIIQMAILKIACLLSLVFGTAGSDIIAQNFLNSGQIKTDIRSRKKMCIFGFCDIRNFTDMTECLQEGVMIFVNRIASIVHEITHQFGGNANKNIGDAFLLVWRMPDKFYDQINGSLKLIDSMEVHVQQIADCALLSFVKTIILVSNNYQLKKYSQNHKIRERMGNDFRVKLGFGLHIGWAVEGAIGSEFKIDASYLGNNVNMSNKLQAATKKYGVPLLISEEMVQSLSSQMRDLCRQVDLVCNPEENVQFGLFTLDINMEQNYEGWDNPGFQEQLQFSNLSSFIASHPYFSAAFKPLPSQFLLSFRKGFDLYVAGNWTEARACFEQCLSMRSEDGPSKYLLGQVSQSGNLREWKGYGIFDDH